MQVINNQIKIWPSTNFAVSKKTNDIINSIIYKF